MADWKEILAHFTYDTERKIDELRCRLVYALGGLGPVKILTYCGYGRPDLLTLRGRVIEDRHLPEAGQNDYTWENLLNLYRRMESKKVPHARLVARFGGVKEIVQANEEGHFEVWIKPSAPLTPDRICHPVELELLDPIPDSQQRYPVRATGEVLVPLPGAEYVVISAIDDTVVCLDAARLLKLARLVFLGDAHIRLPFPGLAAFYRALFDGTNERQKNPLLYVSSCPWNLYDLLVQFFFLNEIPIGPVLFLRDRGIDADEIPPQRSTQLKLKTIRQMLEFYPELPFVLLGDSAQEDPEIYAQLIHEFPGRVKAAYIRNVSRDHQRPQAIRELAKKVLAEGSSLLLADDSLAMARDAVEKGLILPDTLPLIHAEKNKDEAPPTLLEKILAPEE